jgi:hypothetical protein
MVIIQGISSVGNKKAELTGGSSFGSSAVFSRDPPLSALFSRRVKLYRESQSNYYFRYQKTLNSSIPKIACENYLFED